VRGGDIEEEVGREGWCGGVVKGSFRI